MTLYHVFSEFLEDISEDVLPNEATGFKQSKIWSMLYDFQRDAVLAIINKLEKFNGCILADSVGLGKTFTALAVIKYYENRNKTVLVLCPKRLSENWNTFKDNYVNNPIATDRLNYDVLFHTDLSRKGGMSNGLDLDRLNWGNYDLVVIDESHNFRNGEGGVGTHKRDGENRYQILMRKIIRSGVKTKVLMLSATPVNNRFLDLRNQLALAYEGNPEILEKELNTKKSIDEIFRQAQRAFNEWSDLKPEKRTTDALLRMLDFDFFELLDSVTIARSRKHIEKYYNTAAIGKFPERLKPISLRPNLTDLNRAINYNEIFEQLGLLSLCVYTPSSYILPSTLLDPEYVAYLDGIDVHATHRGYFSIDKKTGRAIDSQLKRGSEFSDDISAYDLILKNKERLLSFEEPTRFIFSHSALREGWDNPNVFQICTLKHGGDSTTQKRQEVGRGLRLCVNQAGERMDAETVGADVHVLNTLTVIASEGYADFVAALQDETRAVLYDRPRKASIEYFEGKNVIMADGSTAKINASDARKIYQYLVRNNYVDEDDGITQDYRDDVAADRLKPLPEGLQPIGESIHKLVQAIFDDKVLKEMFADGNKTPAPENPLNDRFYKKEFQNLWTAINHKYAYTVDFDSDELIRKAVAAINSELFVSQLQYTVSVAGQKASISGDEMRTGNSFEAAKTHTETLKHAETSQVKYDLVGKIAEGTVLTRRSAAAILKGINPAKFYMFRNNPEEFISKVIRLIKEQKATMIVEHITYDQIEGSYDSSIFTAEKHGKTFDQAFHADKAIQDYVFTDGTAEDSVERRFVKSLDGSQDVFIYAKLPRGFSIPTPVGHYSPDWAIVFHEGTVRHIYFVAETKGTMDSLNLRPIEKAKIDCAKKLFTTLSNGMVTYDHVDDFQQLMNKVMV